MKRFPSDYSDIYHAARTYVLQMPDWGSFQQNIEIRLKILTEEYSENLEELFSSRVSEASGKIVPSRVNHGSSGSGVYFVSFVPATPGDHVVEVEFEGRPILGSPATFTLCEAGITDSDSFLSKLFFSPVRLLGGAHESFVGERTRFVTTRISTQTGKTVRFDSSAYRVEILLREESGECRPVRCSAGVEVLPTGGIMVEFTPEHVGDHEVHVFVHTRQVLQRPYLVTVKARLGESLKLSDEKGDSESIVNSDSFDALEMNEISHVPEIKRINSKKLKKKKTENHGKLEELAITKNKHSVPLAEKTQDVNYSDEDYPLERKKKKFCKKKKPEKRRNRLNGKFYNKKSKTEKKFCRKWNVKKIETE